MSRKLSEMRDADMPLLERIERAIDRITSGSATMRVPVEATDPDIVLRDAANRVARLEEALRNSAKAIEFAEYLAKAAERFQKAGDSILEYYVEGEEPPQEKREDYSEHYRGVRESIYEFRKRAARAALGETGGRE